MSSSAQFSSLDPATGQPTWTGRTAGSAEVSDAINRARGALEQWADLPSDQRADFLHRFGEQVKARRDDLIEAICRSTGKPKWESATEVDAVVGKIALTIEAHRERRQEVSREVGGASAVTRYKPHGVVAVFGPFNFPAHLPNGHILPALLAGNTVIFKPSEQTPLVGQIYSELWEAVGLPAGVFNLLQGGRETGAAIGSNAGIDGIYFTGSSEAGVALARASVENPGKILALEMGGNNPLIVHRMKDHVAAAYWTIQSAFITAGQRCSCARRLILVDDDESRAFLDKLVEMTRGIRVGRFDETPDPFMGPVISAKAAQKLLDAQSELIGHGARSLVEMKQAGDCKAMLLPGIVDVTDIERNDVEYFGPLLQVIRVRDFGQAIFEANNTRYGLVAGLFSDDRSLWERFYRCVRAGVVNFNRPTTGATGHLPFGGIGRSGNHRPSGYFSVDYCSYPVASMEAAGLALPDKPSPGISIT